MVDWQLSQPDPPKEAARTLASIWVRHRAARNDPPLEEVANVAIQSGTLGESDREILVAYTRAQADTSPTSRSIVLAWEALVLGFIMDEIAPGWRGHGS